MRLDPRLLHLPSLARKGLAPHEQTYLDTLQALADSQRNPDEMREAADVLNALLDARARAEDPASYDEIAGRLLKHARAVRDARSGMGCDLALDFLHLTYDEARAAS